MSDKQDEINELGEMLYEDSILSTRMSRRKAAGIIGSVIGLAIAGYATYRVLGFPIPKPKPKPTQSPSPTQTPEKTEFQKFVEEYPELAEGFTELNYKSALMYKKRFPELFEEPDFHEHLNKRIRYEDIVITKLEGDPLSKDIFDELRYPNLEYDLKVEEESKEMFGDIYGYSLKKSILSKDFPKKEDRTTIHVSKALPLGIEYFSIGSMQRTGKPSLTAVVDNIKKIVNNDLPFELENVIEIYNDENSQLHKLAIKNLNDRYVALTDLTIDPQDGRPRGTFARDLHYPAQWFIDNIDPLLLTDKRTKLQRFIQAFSEEIASEHSDSGENRTYVAPMLAKKVGGTIIETMIPRKTTNYKVYHEETAQPLPVTITDQLYVDDLIELPGKIVSIEFPTLSTVKKQGIPYAYYLLPQREKFPYIIEF